MTPLELARELDGMAYELDNGFVTYTLLHTHVLKTAVALIRRWESGDFTREEIHNFCYKLESVVSLEEFKKDCIEYQKRLYECGL